ncbi:hypothetical protein UT300012_21860 [Paraclostridium bifermentans]
MDRMSIVSEQLDDNLEQALDIIDDCLHGIYRSNNWETGGGRDVLLLDKYVIKFPKEDALDIFSGVSQNLKEAEVYFATKDKNLVPVYTTHLGCIVCKRVEGDLVEYYQAKFDIDEMQAIDLLEKEIANKIKELQPIIDKYKLYRSDLLKINSWGYDKDTNNIVCLDYGLNVPSETSYTRILRNLSDNDLLDAFQIGVGLLDSCIKYEIPKLDGKQSYSEKIERVFNASIIPKVGAKLIMEECVRRGLAEFRRENINELRDMIQKEIPNESVFESKIKEYKYNRTITLDCIGFEVNVYKYEYDKALIHLCKKLFEYRVLRAFKLQED